MLPTEEFTELTEKGVKQFQTDYMKISPTGEVDRKTLDSIDEFNRKYSFLEGSIKCSNCTCGGFGNGKYSKQKGDSKIAERYRKYEYPGIHRSLIWVLKAIIFYFDETNSKLGYSFSNISSGYRCWLNNARHARTSTNHMGKSLDLRFNKNSLNDIETIRDEIFLPKIGAQLRWGNVNKFSLEPSSKNYTTEYIATSWIHIDVRRFDLKYLDDSFFVKNINDATGYKIVSLNKNTIMNIKLLGLLLLFFFLFSCVKAENINLIKEQITAESFDITDNLSVFGASKDEFDKVCASLEVLSLPVKYSFEFIIDLPKFKSLPKILIPFFSISDIQNVMIAKMPPHNNVQMFMISANDESGETLLYLCCITNKINILPIFSASDYEKENQFGTLSLTFEIARNYKISTIESFIPFESNKSNNVVLKKINYLINENGDFYEVKE